jgi:methyltransferase
VIMIVLAAALIIVIPMLAETALAMRHDRALRAAGAIEPADDVYPLMRVVYPASFAAMLAEGAWRGVTPDATVVAGAIVFAAAKGLKYWAIATLGPRWTFRVLVPPGSTMTRRGPYRWFPHPNYIGVAGELLGTALALHAAIAGPIAVIGFCAILVRRVRVEERALVETPR